MGLPTLVEKNVDKIWTTMIWAIHDGEVPTMRALRSILGWRTTTWWRNRSAWGMTTDPTNVDTDGSTNSDSTTEECSGTPRCRSGRAKGKDWIRLMAQGPLRKEDVTISLLTMMRQPTETREAAMTKQPGDLKPLVLKMPAEDKKLVLEIRRDSKTIVDWVNGHVKLKTKESTICECPESLAGMVRPRS